MDTIKTRILLRNDTLANWESASSITLQKGEVGIAMLDGNLAEVRIGDNTKWSASRKLRVEADQISGLIDTINTQISGKAYEYQLTAGTGADANKWFLESRPLSGGSWETVSTLDLTQLTGYALSTDVDALVAAVSAATYESAFADASAYTDEQIAGLSIDNYMLTSTFSTISTEIGLNRASSTDPVVVSSDIAALDNVMHFKGVVNAVPTSTTGYEAGDVVIVAGSSVEADNGKEFVLVDEGGTLKWEQIGDQNAISTLTEYVDTTVSTVSSELTGQIDGLATTLNTVSSDYLTSSDKEELTGLIASTSAEAITSANAYTDAAIDALSIGDYATVEYVNGVSAALSGDYVSKIATAKTEAYNEALSDANDYTDAAISGLSIDNYYTKAEVNQISSDLSTGLVGDIEDAIDALSIDNYIKHGEVVQSDLSGFFVFDCGGASLREGEPAS